MPMSSQEIAAVNGAWQQATAQRMQYGAMISQGDVYGSAGAQAERVVSGVINRTSAIGAPVLMGAAALAGLDPMSAGLTAAWSARGAGLMGAAGAGAAAALPLLAVGAVASYAGGQVMEGASQQSGLNQTLRGTYNFRNRQGGSGFNTNEMSSIGTMIRDMSGQFGPGGEVVGFRELTQLAGKMSTMGLAQGVKDVKDFAERFKHMVTSLKTMATDLGTTLEGAMEFASAARQSGVFGMKGAAMFATEVRQAAVAGGLAKSEVTGAASIGSQIVRSVGGLGKQGLHAGIRTIENIGTMQQLGLLSEEDIYNVTGQTGAEGRQAYAASQMQRTANFLQTGRGRRMLASMAGKDGTLDESAVQQFLAGGMSKDETTRLDDKMKSTVGRANFIRNEGRLRGAVMERFGGNSQTLQLMEWAASRGVDINDMDERSMLFAQRQLGMGRDDVDQAVKQAQAMPRLMEEQRRSDVRDTATKQYAQMMKGRGLEGVQHRFEQAKTVINGKVQRAGQDLSSASHEWVEGLLNKMLDVYVDTQSQEVDDAVRGLLHGSGGQAASVFGIGRGAGLRRVAGAAASLGVGRGRSLEERMTAGSMGGAGASLSKMLTPDNDENDYGVDFVKFLLHGQSPVGQMKEAGFDISGMNSEQMRAKFSDIDKLQGVASQAAMGSSALGSDANSEWIRSMYASGKMPSGGDARIAAFGEELRRRNPKGAAFWDNMSQAEKVRHMAAAEARTGITGGGALAARYGVPEALMGTIRDLHGQGNFSTKAEENRAYAKAFGYYTVSGYENQANVGGLDKWWANTFGGGQADRFEARGAFIKSDEFRKTAQKLFNEDRSVVEKAQEELGNQLGSIAPEDRAEADEVKNDMLVASKYEQQKQRFGAGSRELTDWVEKNGQGMSLDLLEVKAAGARSVVQGDYEKNINEAAKQYGGVGREELRRSSRLGLFDATTGELTAAKHDELMTGGGAAGVAYALSGQKSTELMAGMWEGKDNLATNEGILEGLHQQANTQKELRRTMSAAQMRAAAGSLAGTPGGSGLVAEAGMEERLIAGGKRKGGAAKTIAGILSVGAGDISTREAADKWAEKVIQEKGLTSDDTIKMVHQAANAARRGDVKTEGEALRSIQESGDYRAGEKKRSAEEDEAKNPTQAAIKKNTEDTAKYLGQLIEGNKRINVQVLGGKLDAPQDHPEFSKPVAPPP